jgi:diacylglycerol kinase (ATP)
VDTTGFMDGWKKAQTVDIDNYSALVAVGGDGTLHEVVNGMMFRPDKKRIPIAFLPNGSGNDTCKSIGCHSV